MYRYIRSDALRNRPVKVKKGRYYRSKQGTMTAYDYVASLINNKYGVPVAHIPSSVELDGSSELHFNWVDAYNLVHKSDVPEEEALKDSDCLQFLDSVKKWLNTVPYVLWVSAGSYIDRAVLKVKGGLVRSDGSWYDLDVAKFYRRKTDPEVWDRFMAEVVDKDPDHFVTGDMWYVLYVQDMTSPEYRESSMDFARRVFKGQYGGYMADVTHLLTSMPKYVIDWFEQKNK